MSTAFNDGSGVPSPRSFSSDKLIHPSQHDHNPDVPLLFKPNSNLDSNLTLKPPTDVLKHQHRAYIDPYIDHLDPPEVYPLTYPSPSASSGWGGGKSWTYWPALALVGVLGGSVPVSFVYIGWCIAMWDVPGGSTGKGLLIYSVFELATTLYQAYQTYLIQRPSPPSTLTPEECLGILTRILQSGTGLSGKAFDQDEREEEEKGAMGLSTSISGSSSGSSGSGLESGPPKLRARTAKQARKDPNISLDPIPSHLRPDTPTQEEKGGYTASPLIPLETLREDDPRAIEFRERLRNWFGRVPFSSVTLSDAQNWLSWSCCGLSYAQVQQDVEKSRLIETGVQLLQARTGWKFPISGNDSAGEKRGLAEKVKLMRLTMDPVRVFPRPLWWYAALWIGDRLAMKYIYHSFGLRQYKQGQMDYLLRIPKGWTPERQLAKSDPIVFIHGLGFGLLSPENMLVVRKLCKTLSSHPILVPLQPQISQQIWDPDFLRPTPRKQFVGDLVDACRRWRFYDDQGVVSAGKIDHEYDGADERKGLNGARENGGVILLSHSNGSVGHTWLLKDVPGLTRRNALVDPVVFCSWEGDLCYNFCYRPARSGMECLLKYLVSTELGIANTIQRYFDWSANTLFPEEIPDARDPEKTLIVLGGTDIIVDAQRVRVYLKRHGLRRTMQYDPTKGHVDGLRGTSLDRLIIWLATGKSVDVPSASALA